MAPLQGFLGGLVSAIEARFGRDEAREVKFLTVWRNFAKKKKPYSTLSGSTVQYMC